MSNKFLSIVIPARNAANTIAETLNSVFKYLPENSFDVIVVVNDSTDDTAEIIKKYNGVKLIESPKSYVSKIRNIGAKEAKGPLLAFIDSDMLITEEWYPSIQKLFEDETIGISGSYYHAAPDAKWIEKTWDRSHNKANLFKEEMNETIYIPGGNLISTTKVFKEVGGFDPTLETGEEPDICIRVKQLGYKIIDYKKIKSFHLGNPKTFLQILKREKWHGKGVRLKYANGKLAPIAVSTLLFSFSIVFSIMAIISSVYSNEFQYLFLLLSILFIPLLYSVYYGLKFGILQIIKLTPIYFFYFLGRSISFPETFLKKS